MEQVKVLHDRTGNTLTVWFGNPQEEYSCEDTGDEVILMKDRTGRVIGFEKLQFSTSAAAPLHISFETVSVRGVAMKKEYDFSKGERGKFYHTEAEFDLPIYDNSGEDYLYPAHYFAPFDWDALASEGGAGHTALTISLDPHTKAILRAEALATHQSMGALVRQWIAERLALHTE